MDDDEDYDDDDYDDAPLLTREPSYRIIRYNSTKSLGSAIVEQQPADKDVKYSLPYLAANLHATVLEDVLTQLRVLDECNNQLRIYKTKSDFSQLRCGKYGISSSEMADELLGVDTKNLESEHYKLNKLASDRNYCKDVLASTYLSLALKDHYGPLAENVQIIVNRRNHLLFLIDDEAKNRVISRELVKRLRQQRVRLKSAVYETNIVVDNLRSQVEDATLMKEVRGRYLDKWQNSRSEQHFWDIQETELKPTESITHYRRRLEEEQRAHSEVDLHSNILMNEVLKKVEEWMSKYDVDIEAIDLQIQVMKINAQTQKETRQEMEELLAARAEEMKKWLQFKLDREKANQYRLKMTSAAIVVQAWWRGLLVRMELGPFKIKKKKAVKSDKKK